MNTYDLYSPFDIEQHKRTYQNYLEILIQADGQIVYAVPSHTEKACALACEKLNLTRDELVNSCPPEYYCDYLNWLLMQTGSIAVWDKFFVGTPNHAQQAALRKLKQTGLYHGPIKKRV